MKIRSFAHSENMRTAKKRQKAKEKAALEALRAATALVAIVFKKARRARWWWGHGHPD